jgi:hypothetical protein
MAYVYRHIRVDKNEPFYIGIGNDKHFRRARQKIRRNKIWYDIVNKTEFETEILIDNISWEDACKKEKEFILLYGRIDKKNGILANMTDGGNGTSGRIMSEEWRKNKSEMMKGNKLAKGYKHTEENLLLFSKLSKGNKHAVGVKHTDEVKKKISFANKGKIIMKETIEKRNETRKKNKLKKENELN